MTTDHYLFGQEIIDYGLADGYYDSASLPRPRRHGTRRVPETFEPRPRVKPSD